MLQRRNVSRDDWAKADAMMSVAYAGAGAIGPEGETLGSDLLRPLQSRQSVQQGCCEHV